MTRKLLVLTLTLILARGVGRAFVAKGVDAGDVWAFLIDEGAEA